VILIDHVWAIPAAGSSSPTIDAIELKHEAPSYSALYCAASTLATTQSFSVQTAISTAGPWVTEGSTSLPATGNAAGANVLRLTGPYRCIRPVLNTASTGTYTFRLVAVE
jgi:hypothetical protein